MEATVSKAFFSHFFSVPHSPFTVHILESELPIGICWVEGMHVVHWLGKSKLSKVMVLIYIPVSKLGAETLYSGQCVIARPLKMHLCSSWPVVFHYSSNLHFLDDHADWVSFRMFTIYSGFFYSFIKYLFEYFAYFPNELLVFPTICNHFLFCPSSLFAHMLQITFPSFWLVFFILPLLFVFNLIMEISNLCKSREKSVMNHVMFPNPASTICQNRVSLHCFIPTPQFPPSKYQMSFHL